MCDSGKFTVRRLLICLSAAIICLNSLSVRAQSSGDLAVDFVPPFVQFIDNDYGSTLGSQLFHDLVPEPEAFIRDACTQVVQMLYDRVEDVPFISSVILYLEDYDGIAVAWGPRPQAYIKCSTRWFQTTWDNSGGDSDVLLNEITGLLHHELTHSYQQNGNQIPVHAVEGLADAVRIALGSLPYSNRWPGGSYTDMVDHRVIVVPGNGSLM